MVVNDISSTKIRLFLKKVRRPDRCSTKSSLVIPPLTNKLDYRTSACGVSSTLLLSIYPQIGHQRCLVQPIAMTRAHRIPKPLSLANPNLDLIPDPVVDYIEQHGLFQERGHGQNKGDKASNDVSAGPSTPSKT